MDEYINKIDMFNSSYHKRLLNTSSLYKNIIISLKNKNRNKPSTYNGKKIFLNLFVNYWSKFLDLCDRKGIKLRESVTDNVNALITCGDTFYGFTYYECIECGIFDLVPFTCKSRFCPSCGYKYREERTLEIKKKCIDVKHRHMVFTISDKLRIFFDLDRSLIDDLFEAINRTFKNLEYDFKKTRNGVSKKKCNRQFGFISTLHTFGRDLKFNPHIHVLVAECVLENGHIKNYSYFNYEKMRKCFMYNLIKLLNKSVKESTKLSDKLKKEYRIIASTIFNDYDNGFYCYLPPIQGSDKNSNKKLIEYITRYSGHPAISESRILNINYEKDEVTYFYVPHEDNRDINIKDKEITVTESVYDFLAKLIVHIPENGSHNIRYYGFYSNKTINKDKVKKEKGSFYSNIKLSKEKRELDYRYNIIKSFNYDPLKCMRCGKTMTIDLEMCYIPDILRKRVGIRYG